MTADEPRYLADEDLLDRVRETGEPAVRVSEVSSVTVVMGRASDPAVELNLAACEADGVPVLRRRGGGCSVVLDPGNLIVSVVLPLPGLTGIRPAFNALTQWLIDGLDRIGVPGVEHDGISDLVRHERKVSGSCVYRAKGLFYYSATLLVDPDLAAVSRYLAHPPREPEYRRGRPHDLFMGRLSLPDGGGPAEFGQALRGVLTVDSLPAINP